MKWVKGGAPREQNYNLPAKKNEYRYEKNISRICCENSLTVTDRTITKIINSQRDIKLGQFTEEEFNVVLIKIKKRKAASLDEITLSTKYERQGNLLTYWSDSATL